MPHSAASDLGLHCLPITLLGVSRLQWVNQSLIIQIFIRQLETLGRFCTIINRQTTLSTSCLYPCTSCLFWKGFYYKWEELVPMVSRLFQTGDKTVLIIIVSIKNNLERPFPVKKSGSVLELLTNISWRFNQELFWNWYICFYTIQEVSMNFTLQNLATLLTLRTVLEQS